jgi:hypothetical protein
MPRDEKQTKLGGKVTVTVKPKSKRRLAAPVKPEDRRYGPPPFPDDDERLPPRPQTVYLLDGTNFYLAARTLSQRWYKPEEVVFPDVGGFVEIGEVAPATRYTPIVGSNFYDPELVEETYKIDVKNPHTGNIFKRIFFSPSLTKTTSDILGMSVVLGTKEYAIVEANSKYRANKTSEERLAIVEAQIEAGSTPELIEKRDNILLEIEELLTADFTEPLRWDNDYRAYAVPEAFLQAEANGKTWEIKTTGIYFEPFNPFDTDNFYVTEGNFGDEEVEAPKLNGKDILYVSLAPQNWLSTLTLDSYERTGANVVEKTHRIQYSYADAIIGPVAARVLTDFSSYARDFYPDPIPQYDPLHATSDVSYVYGGFERVTPLVPSGMTYGTDATPQRSAVAMLGFDFTLPGASQLASNCHNRIEQGNSHVEKFCGSFLFKKKNYNVFRKTERVAVDPVLIYDGRADSPANTAGTVKTGSNLDYSWFDTFYPGHTNADLGTVTLDLRP